VLEWEALEEALGRAECAEGGGGCGGGGRRARANDEVKEGGGGGGGRRGSSTEEVVEVVKETKVEEEVGEVNRTVGRTRWYTKSVARSGGGGGGSGGASSSGNGLSELRKRARAISTRWLLRDAAQVAADRWEQAEEAAAAAEGVAAAAEEGAAAAAEAEEAAAAAEAAAEAVAEAEDAAQYGALVRSRLPALAGRAYRRDIAAGARRALRAVTSPPSDSGLLPIQVNQQDATFDAASPLTLGARGDSYYEYLLKHWLHSGKPPGAGGVSYLLSNIPSSTFKPSVPETT